MKRERPLWLEGFAARPFLGALVAGVFVLAVGLGLSVLFAVVQELAR